MSTRPLLVGNAIVSRIALLLQEAISPCIWTVLTDQAADVPAAARGSRRRRGSQQATRSTLDLEAVTAIGRTAATVAELAAAQPPAHLAPSAWLPHCWAVAPGTEARRSNGINDPNLIFCKIMCCV
ncbi:hypothetical protein NL676_006465 [Syzygium grande]|nr:hypothetical protein NL676_006465 [Syzygium grande]